MTLSRSPISVLLVLFLFLQANNFCLAQPHQLDPEKWANELSKTDNIQWLDSTLAFGDSATVFQFLNELYEKGKSKGYPFHARFNCLKAAVITTQNVYYVRYQDRMPMDLELTKKQLTELYSSAMDMAYKSEDEYLIAYVSYKYASGIALLGEVGTAVMYGKNAIDLYEKLGYDIRPERYQFLAELLYKVREYGECIHYAKKAVAAWKKSPNEIKRFRVSCINTVALGFHRQKVYDSAIVFYNQALALAKQTNDTIWTGIVSGNMGQLFYAQGKYDTAYKLLKMDYEASNETGFYDNAAHSLQWAARTNLARGNTLQALTEVRRAFELLRLWPDPYYLRNTYSTSTEIFKKMGAYDSAFYYNNLYSVLNDSIERVVATSSLAISKARLNDEISRYNIKTLNKEKRSQVLFRNIIIAAIVGLSLIALLIVNRQRLKEKLKTEKAEQEKLRIEEEMTSARAQLKMFTENIIEKTNLVEKLELQVKGNQATSEQHEIIAELSRQTILTEDDWMKFKSLFEKIYPGFFIKLKEKFPDITIAEQRMAALTRLQLTTKQIASILGISIDSVHKSRQRLRQRFQIGADSNLDELVAGL